MNSKKICVLGAAGAIGSRLVTLLHQQNFEVTAVVRSWSSAVRIGRFDIPIVSLDLLTTSVESLADVINSHDIVIDCTCSGNGDYDQRVAESLHMAETICTAAIKVNVKRLIHYSTVSVYPVNANKVDETVDCVESGDSYGDSKLAAERFFLKQSKTDLSVTVLQLPIVFGPFMGWSTFPVAQMLGQELVMPEGLKGWCAPLFVDDVVHATILAFDCKGSYGERILLSDKSMSWYEYFSAYTKHAGSLSLSSLAREKFIEREKKAAHSLKPFQKIKSKFINDGDFRQLILSQWGIRSIYALVKQSRGQEGIDQIKQKIESSVEPRQTQVLLSENNVQLFDSLPEVNANKAKEVLGMNNYTSFDDAMLSTYDWLKWARLIN